MDLPFIPHLGIANVPELNGCKTLVDRLNEELVEIRATVDAPNIIGYEGERTWPIAKCALVGGNAV